MASQRKSKRTNFEWGARSAIQKAIRRSDGGMLTQALDVLWRIEPSWLFWRMPVLAAEGVPQLTGEICVAAKEASILRASQKTEAAKQLILQSLAKVCSYKKDLTTWAITNFLYATRYHGFSEPDIPDADQRKRWEACKLAFRMIEEGRGDALWKSLLNRASDLGDSSISDIVSGTHNRFIAGGMDGDKVLMAVTSIVALGDYAGTNFLSSMQDSSVDITPRQGDWPWYCYDMHTLVGKRALSYVTKKYNLDKDTFAGVWFNFESNLVSRGGLSVGTWYPAYKAAFMQKHNLTQEQWDDCIIRRDLSLLIPRFALEC